IRRSPSDANSSTVSATRGGEGRNPARQRRLGGGRPRPKEWLNGWCPAAALNSNMAIHTVGQPHPQRGGRGGDRRSVGVGRPNMAIQDAIEIIETACTQWSLGYDQYNRLDFRDGGETDCSALVILTCEGARLLPGNDIRKAIGATYTGNM